MFFKRVVALLVTAAATAAASSMTECDVYQQTWNIIDYYNKADLSDGAKMFPTQDPPIFVEDLIVNMGNMVVSIDQYLEAFDDIAMQRLQANPTWVDCSPWEWCHMHLMTTYHGPAGGSISHRQYWTFIFNADCRVSRFNILVDARDNDFLTNAFGTGTASEL